MRFTIVAIFLALFVATFAAAYLDTDDEVCKGKKFKACLPCCQKHGFKEDIGNIPPLTRKGFQCICATDYSRPSERELLTGRLEREDIYGKDYYKSY